MLSRMRKTYDAAFKAKVAFEAAKGEKTIAQIAGEFGVHPNQTRQWRNHLMEQLPELFSSRRPQQERAREEIEAEIRVDEALRVLVGAQALRLCLRHQDRVPKLKPGP